MSDFHSFKNQPILYRSLRDSSGCKGFTLIELLIVIAIIALLLALLLPPFYKAKEQGRFAICKANLSNYGSALNMYLTDNKDTFCEPANIYFSQLDPYPVEKDINIPFHLRWCNGDLDLKKHPEYGGVLFPYMKSAQVFICPSLYRIAIQEKSQDPYFIEQGHLIKNYDPWYSYTMNVYLCGESEYTLTVKNRVRKISLVKYPSETFAFTEESTLVDPGYNYYALNNTTMIPSTDAMIEDWLDHPSVKGNYMSIKPGPEGVGQFWNVIAGYHQTSAKDNFTGKGNCAFLDGHVTAHSREETFQLAWPK